MKGHALRLLTLALFLATTVPRTLQATSSGQWPECSPKAYSNVEPPDRLSQVFGSRRMIRLVIGASTNMLDPSRDAPFVAATAKLVDGALERAGYRESAGLLIGNDANRQNVLNALKSLESLDPTALVVIYYVGHGTRSVNGDDLVLSVADAPVGDDSGLAVRSILATALKPFDPKFRKIPRIILVIESCFSGSASVFQPGLRSVFAKGDPTDFTRLAFISSTGWAEESRPLPGAEHAAFGKFFADALDQDWACSDKTADGALTVMELATFVYERLADLQKELGGKMQPDFVDRGNYSTVVYRPERVADKDGYRRAIAGLYQVDVTVDAPVVSTVIKIDGHTVATCTVSCGVLTDSPELTSAEVTYRIQDPLASIERTSSLSLNAPGERGTASRSVPWRPFGGGAGTIQITVR